MAEAVNQASQAACSGRGKLPKAIFQKNTHIYFFSKVVVRIETLRTTAGTAPSPHIHQIIA